MKLLRKIKEQSGIGFLEMIAAIGVIVVGVIAGMTLTTSNLTAVSASEARLKAANLARESIEVIRNMRDSNWMAETAWSEGIIQDPDKFRLITEFDPANGTWSFIDRTADIGQCNNCQLYYHPANGVYTHDSTDGQVTNYRRLVTLREVCWQEEINQELVLSAGTHCSDSNLDWIGWQIESEVTWSDGVGDHSLSVIDGLYDWR